MKLRGPLSVLVGTVTIAGCLGSSTEDRTFSTLPQKIVFGSCMHQDRPKPVLDLAAASGADLFVFLGDNIYGDTDDMTVLQGKYAQLETAPELVRLRESMDVIATWDDHDYGRNDAGAEYPYRQTSAEIFLDFWQEPAGTDRRTREGIYTSYLYEEHGKRLQIILLDLRTFRTRVLPVPNHDETVQMLGKAQWTWLEQQLMLDADVRIIGSSTQFSHTANGYESWTNMPFEQQRLLDLIRTTAAGGVLFISGDVHWGELSRLDPDDGYPIWDLTSSGITETWDSISKNKNRVGEPVAENNYGSVTIDWNRRDPTILLELIDQDNVVRVSQEILLSGISW